MFSLVPTAILAVGPLLGSPRVPVEEDVDAVVAGLAEKLHAVTSFVAEYSVERADGQVTSACLAYQAPDMAKLVFRHDDLSIGTWFRHDTMSVRESIPGQSPGTAEIDLQDLLLRDSESPFEKAFEKAFPRSKWTTPATGISLCFEMVVRGDIAEQEGSSILTLVGRPGLRPSLGWLDDVGGWPGERLVDDEHVVFQLSENSSIAVSRETGFIERWIFTSKDGEKVDMKLVRLSVDEAVDADQFVPPPAPENAKNVEDKWTSSFASAQRNACRGYAFRAALEDVSEVEDFDDDLRDRLSTVLRAWHGHEVRSGYGSWIEKCAQSIEDFGKWCRDVLESAGDSPETLAHLRRSAQDWREKFAENCATMIESYLEALSPSVPAELGSELAAACAAIEADAVRAAFESEVSAPLLERFEETIAEDG